MAMRRMSGSGLFAGAPAVRALVGAGLLALVWPSPASAQSEGSTVEDLDRFVPSGGKAEDGVALARSQVDAGTLLEALATLDRTLALKPKNKQARLLHASVLCLIDDRLGASIEFARLRIKDYSKAQWSAAQAPCLNATAAPAAPEPGT